MAYRADRGAVLRSMLGKTAAVLAAIAAVLTPGEGFNPTPQSLPPSKSHTSRQTSMRAPLANTVQTGDEARLSNITRTIFEEDTRPVLLYDGVCKMCNGFVNLFLDLDKDAKFRFSALQSQTGRALLSMSGRSPDDISSIVLVEANGNAHVQSDALLRMGRLLGGFVGLVLFPGIIVPKFIRNKLYDVVADNRYSFLGKREECRCSDERFAERFI